MAVLDTGWVRVGNGGQTEVVIPQGKITQVRVRWRGVDHSYTEYDTTDASRSGTAASGGGIGPYSLRPADKSGWKQLRTTVSVSCASSVVRGWLCGVQTAGKAWQTASGTGKNGSKSYTWYPGDTDRYNYAEADMDGTDPYDWDMSASIRWSREVTDNTVNPKITVDANDTQHTGTLLNGVASDWTAASGFVAGATNVVAHTISGSELADVQIEVTYTPTFAPLLLEPGAYARATAASLVFEVLATEPDGSAATAWFPKILLSDQSDLTDATTFDASTDQTDWEYWDDVAEDWAALTGDGAPVGAKCRLSPDTSAMAMGRWYWALLVWDDETELWSEQSAIRQFRMVLTLAARVACEIETVDQTANVRAIKISETTNGELGRMAFELYVPPAGSAPSVGDAVVMAVRDVDGNDEQFEGWVAEEPARVGPRIFAIRCSLPDSILAQRYILEDYASQDVGVTLKAIVDDYCSPLDSSGINTSTGFSRPVTAFGRTALDVFKEVRDQYGLLFWVNSTDSRVYLVSPDDVKGVTLHVLRGRPS